MQIGKCKPVEAKRRDRGNFRTHAISQLYGVGPPIEREVKLPNKIG
jgi:hypothetical protein